MSLFSTKIGHSDVEMLVQQLESAYVNGSDQKLQELLKQLCSDGKRYMIIKDKEPLDRYYIWAAFVIYIAHTFAQKTHHRDAAYTLKTIKEMTASIWGCESLAHKRLGYITDVLDTSMEYITMTGSTPHHGGYEDLAKEDYYTLTYHMIEGTRKDTIR